MNWARHLVFGHVSYNFTWLSTHVQVYIFIFERELLPRILLQLDALLRYLEQGGEFAYLAATLTV